METRDLHARPSAFPTSQSTSSRALESARCAQAGDLRGRLSSNKMGWPLAEPRVDSEDVFSGKLRNMGQWP